MILELAQLMLFFQSQCREVAHLYGASRLTQRGRSMDRAVNGKSGKGNVPV